MGFFTPEVVDPDIAALAAEYEDLLTVNVDRIQRIQTYRDENNAMRDRDTLKFAGNSDDDYGRQSNKNPREPFRHRIELPLGKALNVKHSYRISGKLPDCIVDKRDESPQEKHRSDTMEKIVWAIMRASRGQTEVASGAWDGSEVGSTAFDMYWDHEKQIPVFRACDPAGVLEVIGVDDPHDFERVYRSWDVPLSSVIREYSGKTVDGTADGQPVKLDAIKSTFVDKGVKMVTLVQQTDKHKHVRFVRECNVKLYEYTHDYGFVNYVIIPNIGPYRDVHGWADYEFVRALVSYITALFSREADILRAVANGTYIDKGTGQNADQLRQALSDGGVVPAKKDSALEPVQPPEVPAFESTHAAQAMEMFKMLGFAPDAAWGGGGGTSGSDRGLMLQPLVEYTAMKQMNWEAGLGRLFSYAYRMIEGKLSGDAKYRGSKPSAGNRRLPFSVDLSTTAGPQTGLDPNADPMAGDDGFVDLPTDPKQLFDGDYDVRFLWNNRIDPDDPSYVLSELNKFQHGVQSAETTLERLGFESPEDELKRIEAEAERFPWLNSGMIQLIRAQLAQSNQGDGGGQPADPTADLGGATDMASGPQGAALGADAGAAGLGAGATGQMYGGA